MEETKELRYPFVNAMKLRMEMDGAGITTLVGGMGCPLDCKWCINSYVKKKMHDEQQNFEWITIDELYEKVKEHNLYFLATGGGITFGGGESLLHASFIAAFARKYNNGWKYNIETSLNVPKTMLEEVLPFINEYIVDIKSMNPTIYQAYTGMNNEQVLENLEYLLKRVSPDKIRVKVPFIPEFNNESDQKESVGILKQMGIERIELFSYIK